MRRTMLLLFAAVVVSAVALASASADGLPVVPFVDPAGDSGGEVDITLVSVGFDQGTGMITFAVTVTGFDPGSQDGRYRNIQVYLDTALHSGQRSGGADLMFMADAGPYGIVLHVGHPKQNGQSEPLPPTISFSQNGNVLTWVFNKAELGVTEGSDFEGFNFLLYTTISGTGVILPVNDHAPDGGGSWSYYVPTKPVAPPQPVVVRPVFGSLKTVPSKPVAGKKMVFALTVNRSDTGAPLTTGTMTCDPSVAGKVLRHTESFMNGKARLSFVVPKTAKGKLLKIKVKITDGSQSATKMVTYKVI